MLFYACTVFVFVSVVHISKYKLCNHLVQCSGEIRGQLVDSSLRLELSHVAIEKCCLKKEKNNKLTPKSNYFSCWPWIFVGL